MKKWLMAVMFGAMLVLGACGGGEDDSSSDEPADNGDETVDASEAEDIYEDNCATCHGDDLSGDSGPDLTKVGDSMSKDEIETQIEEGGDGMPADLVSGEDRTTLATWLSEKK